MCLLIVDCDTIVFKACMIAEKTVYDALPLTIKDVPTGQVVDLEDWDSYQQYVIQSFTYAKDYAAWLTSIGKTKADFLRVSRVVMEPLSHTLHTINSMLKDLINVVQPERVKILLTGEDNFRDKVAKLRPYKETRREKPKPYHYEAARSYMVEKYGAIIVDGCEADDMCGILATECFNSGDPYVIAAVDKDLNSIPGHHYNYDDKRWYYVNVKDAERWFWVQALAGDATDCIPGLNKIGEVYANKILGKSQSYVTMYRKAIAAYRNAVKRDRQTTEQRYAGYHTGDELLLEMARLVHMQRAVGEMWEPPE